MRSLFKFILRNYFVFLFLFLEGVSFIFIFQNNAFQKSLFVEHTKNITSFFYKNFFGLREYFHLREENDILAIENSKLRNMLEHQESNGKLYFDSKDTTGRIKYEYIPAKVIYNSVNKQYNYIIVDRGKKQGVYNEMAVITDQGVVGIVSATSNNFATVLPVLNRDFRISAKIKRNNFFGVLEWEGLSPEVAALREIPIHVDVHEGDTIVTSGYSAIFPEGIDIGVVKSVTPTDGNFYDIFVHLSTNYLNLVHVYLIRNYFKEELDTLREGAGL